MASLSQVPFAFRAAFRLQALHRASMLDQQSPLQTRFVHTAQRSKSTFCRPQLQHLSRRRAFSISLSISWIPLRWAFIANSFAPLAVSSSLALPKLVWHRARVHRSFRLLTRASASPCPILSAAVESRLGAVTGLLR